MKRSIACAAIAAPLFFAAAPSHAQNIPAWCLKASMGEDYSVDLCYYQTYEQCARERMNYGSTSFCLVNPQYYFRYGDPKEPKQGRVRNNPR